MVAWGAFFGDLDGCIGRHARLGSASFYDRRTRRVVAARGE